MRQRLTFISVLPLILLMGQLAWAQVGPDDFGYTAEDAPDGFEWVDMSTGTELEMEDDEISDSIALGFAFTFYGEDYEAIHINSNGSLIFEDITTYQYFEGTQCPLPLPSVVDGMIAFYQRDFNPDDAACGDDCHIYHATGNDGERDWFGVSYEAVPVFREAGEDADPVTVQVFLYDDSTIMVYVEVAGITSGQDAVIGIEAPLGITGLNWPGCLSEGSITSDMGIIFTPPTEGTPVVPHTQTGWALPGETVEHDVYAFNLDSDEVIFDITVAADTWTTTADPTTITVAAGGNDSFTVAVEIPAAMVGGEADGATITLSPQSGADDIDVSALTLVQDPPDSWQDVSLMPILIDEPIVAGFGTDLYLFSGTFYDELAAQWFVTSFVQVMHLGGEYLEWEFSYMCPEETMWDFDLGCCADEGGTCSDPDIGTLEPMPDARASATGCGMNDMVYIVGGQGVDDVGGFAADTIFIYNTTDNSWTIGAPMPEGRLGSAVVCDPGRNQVFVISGYGPYDDDGAAHPVANLWVYDVAGNTWDNTVAQPEGARTGHSAELIDANTILVAGGFYDDLETLRTDLYDIDGDTWTQAGDLPYMRALQSSAINEVGRMCLIGGASWGGQFHFDDDTFDCYSDGHWIPQEAVMGQGRSQVVATTMGTAMYVVGGVERNEVGYVQIASVERYPTTDDLPPDPPQPDVPPDAPAEPVAEPMADVGPDVIDTPDTGTDAGADAEADAANTPPSGGGESDDSGCCSVSGGNASSPGLLLLSLLLGVAIVLRRRS